jgi:hypothetical protein
MTTYITLSVLTLDPQSSVLTALPSPTMFGGFALLIARRDDQGWQFETAAGVALDGGNQTALLEHLADILPPTDHVIGWQLDCAIVAPMMSTAAHAPPVVRHHALSRMARAFATGSLDLALAHGGLRAPSLADVVDIHPTIEQIATRDQVEACWRAGDGDSVTDALRQEAIALWHMFLSIAPRSIGSDVVDATDRWLADGK